MHSRGRAPPPSRTTELRSFRRILRRPRDVRGSPFSICFSLAETAKHRGSTLCSRLEIAAAAAAISACRRASLSLQSRLYLDYLPSRGTFALFDPLCLLRYPPSRSHSDTSTINTMYKQQQNLGKKAGTPVFFSPGKFNHTTAV